MYTEKTKVVRKFKGFNISNINCNNKSYSNLQSTSDPKKLLNEISEKCKFIFFWNFTFTDYDVSETVGGPA